MVFIVTLYMQQVLHYSAFLTGISFLPHAMAAIVAAPLGSQLTAKVGVKKTLIGGMILTMLGLLLLSRISVQGNYVRDLLPGTVILGFAIVISLIGTTIAATAGVSDSEQGLASGLFNTSQQVGAAIGLTILVAVSSDALRACRKAASHKNLTCESRQLTFFTVGCFDRWLWVRTYLCCRLRRNWFNRRTICDS